MTNWPVWVGLSWKRKLLKNNYYFLKNTKTEGGGICWDGGWMEEGEAPTWSYDYYWSRGWLVLLELCGGMWECGRAGRIMCESSFPFPSLEREGLDGRGDIWEQPQLRGARERLWRKGRRRKGGGGSAPEEPQVWSALHRNQSWGGESQGPEGRRTKGGLWECGWPQECPAAESWSELPPSFGSRYTLARPPTVFPLHAIQDTVILHLNLYC